MNLRLVAFVAIALFGLVMGPATPAVAQDSKVSSTVVERPSINGESTVLLDVENDTVRIDTETRRRTRREYASDADGRRRLVVTIEENRVDRPDGGQSIVRNFTVPDVNGRPRATRRETEETVPEGGGVFRTLIEVSVPGVNRGRFVSTERVEQTERRDGEQVLEIDRTTYTSQTTRGAWAVRGRRTVRRDYGDHGVRAVESIYTRDGSGDVKTGGSRSSGRSLGETCLRPRRRPARRRRDRSAGSCLERGNRSPRCQGRRSSGGPVAEDDELSRVHQCARRRTLC